VILSEYLQNIFKPKNISKISNQGWFVSALFFHAGSNAFPEQPEYGESSYQNKLFNYSVYTDNNGNKKTRGMPFSNGLKDSFPNRVINEKGLISFFDTHIIDETSLKSIMKNFGTNTKKPLQRTLFFKALYMQFQNLVLAPADFTDDIVVIKYNELIKSQPNPKIKTKQSFVERKSENAFSSINDEVANTWELKILPIKLIDSNGAVINDIDNGEK
jgi:hypothetical protein